MGGEVSCEVSTAAATVADKTFTPSGGLMLWGLRHPCRRRLRDARVPVLGLNRRRAVQQSPADMAPSQGRRFLGPPLSFAPNSWAVPELMIQWRRGWGSLPG